MFSVNRARRSSTPIRRSCRGACRGRRSCSPPGTSPAPVPGRSSYSPPGTSPAPVPGRSSCSPPGTSPALVPCRRSCSPPGISPAHVPGRSGRVRITDKNRRPFPCLLFAMVQKPVKLFTGVLPPSPQKSKKQQKIAKRRRPPIICISLHNLFSLLNINKDMGLRNKMVRLVSNHRLLLLQKGNNRFNFFEIKFLAI